VRVELRTERAQLGFRRELQNLTLTEVSRVAFIGNAHDIDATCDGESDRFEQRDVIGQETPASRERSDFDRDTRTVGGGYEHSRAFKRRDHDRL
jgi:hypothetical protein